MSEQEKPSFHIPHTSPEVGEQTSYLDLSPEEALMRLQEEVGREGNKNPEISLGFDRWIVGVDGGYIPDPNSPLEKYKTQFLEKCGGVKNFYIRMYENPDFEGNFYQLVVETGRPDIYLVETYYPGETGTVAGTSQLSLHYGEPRVFEQVPKGIDVPASLVEGLLRRRIETVTLSNEGHQEDFLECVKDLKYILLDVDDCILPTTDKAGYDMKEIKKLAERIRTLQAVGVECVFNTGRGTADVERYFQLLESFGGPGIVRYAMCENGSVFYDRKKKKGERVKVDPGISRESMAVRDGIFTFLAENFKAEMEKGGVKLLGSFEDKKVGISINPTTAGIERAKSKVDADTVASKRNYKREQVKDIDIYAEWITQLLTDNQASALALAKVEFEKAGLAFDESKAAESYQAIISTIKNSSTAVDINPPRFDEVKEKYVGIDKKRGTYVFCDNVGIRYIGRKEGEKIKGLMGVGDSGGDEPTLEEVDTALPWNATADLRANKKVKVVYSSPHATTEGVGDILRAVYEARVKMKQRDVEEIQA